MRANRIFQYMIVAALALFLGMFLLLPVFTVIQVGCDAGLIMEALRSQVYREGLFNSLLIAAVTTFLVALISLPLALIYDRFDFPCKEWCSLAMLLPMILPPFVGALGFQLLLGHYGVFNAILTSFGFERVDFLSGSGTFWSVCFIEALHLYPIFYLNSVTALGNIDPALNESAANMSINSLRRFQRFPPFSWWFSLLLLRRS